MDRAEDQGPRSSLDQMCPNFTISATVRGFGKNDLKDVDLVFSPSSGCRLAFRRTRS